MTGAGGTKAEGQTRMQTLQVMLNAQGVVDDYEFSDNTNNIANTSGGLFTGGHSTTTTSAQATGK